MDFEKFLKEEADLDDATIARLFDAGFDDVESLELVGVPQLQLIGFTNAEEVLGKILQAIRDGRESKLLPTGLLDQDGE